jgi:uncharacterized protein (TIGR00290 family)
MKALVCWSGGKDSALALHRCRANPDLEICGLLTTFSEEFGRVSMHGVRRQLLEAQAESLGLPLTAVLLPTPPPTAPCPMDRQDERDGFATFVPNSSYEERMLSALTAARADGIEAIVFGDIFLEDLRRYREMLLSTTGLKPLFPIWGDPSRDLFREVVETGVRAVCVCVSSEKLDDSWLGRELDSSFLDDIPDGVDPCGEFGEYHSFVFDGPSFRSPVAFTKGKIVHRGPFGFVDLNLPASSDARTTAMDDRPRVVSTFP